MTMRYYANCTWIDNMFGRALKALGDQGVLDNALIVYCSDHGEMLGERYYRFNKYCLYESSVRVPLILAGSVVSSELRGTQDQRNAELVDIYPTLLKAAGVAIPKHAVGLDLLGNDERRAGFSALHEEQTRAAFMWRTPRHKLILTMKRREDASKYTRADILGSEFYDLQSDPQEWNNLYDQVDAFPDTRADMTAGLFQHLKTLEELGQPSVQAR
jgi:arylsulfatase A-like enzyme